MRNKIAEGVHTRHHDAAKQLGGLLSEDWRCGNGTLLRVSYH